MDLRPSTALHWGHLWTTALHDFKKNGIKQQPRKPPTQKTTQHMNHVEPLIWCTVLVTTCCWHDPHTVSCEYLWKMGPVLTLTLAGSITTGEDKDGCSIRIKNIIFGFFLKIRRENEKLTDIYRHGVLLDNQ